MNKLRNATDTFKELIFYFLAVLTLSTAGYSLFEHKSLWDAAWWSIVTAGTVGYGDQFPTSIGGRLVGYGLIIFSVFFIVPLITARLAAQFIVDNDAFTHDEQEQIKGDLTKVLKILNDEKVPHA